MVNEEDHLRLQGLVSGLRLKEAWNLVDRLDEELGQELPYAYHHEFGFLTSCPTNVGSGLRASVLVHLPGLVLTKEIGKVLQGLGQVGLTFRGLYGEGSEVVGNFFQLSNQTTLGKSEEELIEHLEQDRPAGDSIRRSGPAGSPEGCAPGHGGQDLARLWASTIRQVSFVRRTDELVVRGSPGGWPETPTRAPGIHAQQAYDFHAKWLHLEQAAGRDLPPTECEHTPGGLCEKNLVERGAGSPG